MRKQHVTTAKSASVALTRPDTGTAMSCISSQAPRQRPLDLDDIRVLAYRKWETAGKPPGDGSRFWLEAEQELIREKGSVPC